MQVDVQLHELIYDVDAKAPACVLLQAAFGCGSNPPMLRLFNAKHWITHPTSSMKKFAATQDDWKRVAEVTAKRWGDLPVQVN